MFITLEGMDGSGKTTQLSLLYGRLCAAGYDVLLTREPGGTPIAESIRTLILARENTEMEPLTEALLCAAARAQHVRERVLPALALGKIVLCDRFFDSSIAYQAYGRALGVDVIHEINRAAISDAVPDRTYLLWIDAQTAKDRQDSRERDRIEGAGGPFFERVRKGYDYIKAQPRVAVIDASQAPDAVAEDIWRDLLPRLPLRN